ncbi:MAG: hypothetical protein ACREIC_12330 [Limisphaerales bacterium]
MHLKRGIKANTIREELSTATIRLERQLRRAEHDRERAQERVARLQVLLQLTKRLIGP